MSGQHLMLALASAGCALGFTATLVAAGASVSWATALPIGLIAGALVARYPADRVPLLVIGAGLVAWLAMVPGPFSWWSLPAGAALFGIHLGCVLTSGAPQSTGRSRSGLGRWSRRALVVVGATAVVGIGAGLLAARWPQAGSGQGLPFGAGATALVAGALVAIAGWLLVVLRQPQRPDPGQSDDRPAPR